MVRIAARPQHSAVRLSLAESVPNKLSPRLSLGAGSRRRMDRKGRAFPHCGAAQPQAKCIFLQPANYPRKNSIS